MRKTMVRIFAVILVLAMAVGFLAMIPAQAADSNAIEIVFNNVHYGEKLSLMYAVHGQDMTDYSNVAVALYTDAACTQKWCDATYTGTGTVNEVENCGTFIADLGVPAQAIDTVLYAKATMGKNSSLVQRYSVLEYLHKRLSVDTNNISAEQKAMYENLLAFAASAQPVIYKNDPYTPINSYTYVHVNNGTYKGYATGMYLQNETIWLTDLYADGTVKHWNYQIVGGNSGTLAAGQTESLVIGTQDIILEAVIEGEPSTPEGETQEIVFNFGDNGDATHKDGSDIGTGKTYAEGDNTLTLTDASKVYDTAYDATGNSCLKLGTSSVVGTFTFAVPENVNNVIIYVAGYKATAASISVNGTDSTISTLSNNGEYTAIEIDTSTTKTIVFTTASSGLRAMIDKIVFKTTGAADPSVPEETTAPTEPEETIAPSEPEVTKVVEDGTYAIVANNNSALGTEISSGKISGVSVAVSDNVATGAGNLAWTVTNVEGGVTLYNGSQYLAYASSTDLKLSDDAYVWTILQENNEIYLDVSDETTSTARGLLYRLSDNIFGAFATSNSKDADYCRAIQFCTIKVCEHTNTTTKDAMSETCGQDGYTGDKVCSDCGATIEKGQTIEATGDHTYADGTCSVCGAADPDFGGVETTTKTIEFTFGANGSATHKDGSSSKTSYSETVGDYTLNLTSATNMYPSSYDAKGNSCIKLGSSKNPGSFTFTVPDEVTEVRIYVGKYKANTSKITVNGTAYTLSNNSNDGAYDEIIIDTTSVKTITLSTVSGGIRAMVNTIVYVAVVKE